MSHVNPTFDELAALTRVPDDAELILSPAIVAEMTGLSVRTLERQRHEYCQPSDCAESEDQQASSHIRQSPDPADGR